MNTIKTDSFNRQLAIDSDMEWNVLQVAVDDIIMDLEDVLVDEPLEERYIIEERLAAAVSLKQKLSEDS